MGSFIGVLYVPGALFASKDFITEFTLSGITSSVEKDEISIMGVIQCVLSDINDMNCMI